MKTRMRTLFEVKTDDGLGGTTTWRGDCPRWAEVARKSGQQVTETRVAWVGEPWFCVSCAHGLSH